MVERRRGPDDDRYRWRPFEPNPRFTPDWWNHTPRMHHMAWFIQVLQRGEEVARVRLGEHFPGSDHVGAPRLGREALEIQFIEVSSDHRCRGIGTEVVRRLCAAHPDRRFLAFSEQADGFWSSLGWDRYDHRLGPLARPLFLQPARHVPTGI